MNDGIKKFSSYLIKDGLWILEVFIIVFAVLVLNYVLHRIVNRLHAKLEKTRTNWDNAFVDALRRPLRLLVWIVGLSFAAEIVGKKTQAPIFEAIDPLRNVGVVMVIAWFLIRFAKHVEENIVEHRRKHGKEVDHTTIEAIGKLARVSVIITASLVALQTLGFNIAGVLAFGGIGGIAVGFAAKDLLANFFGAMMIYFDRPFVVGDWIRSPDKNIEGTVESIGWRLTRIRTFDKRPLYVPNAVFTSIAVENPSRMTNRRIYETIGVRYDDVHKLEDIIAQVKSMLSEHEAIDQSQTMIVNFNKFAASSLDFFVYTFTKTTNWIEFHQIKQDVLFKIIRIIEKAGAEVAFPTSTVHVPEPVQMIQAVAEPVDPTGR